MNRKSLIGAAVGGLFAALARPFAADAASPPGAWNWVDGDENSYVGGLSGAATGTMAIQTTGDLDIGARHMRMGTTDGNYEFEHGRGVAETHLNSYYIGTPTRTPISVGDFTDGQDVLSFVVRGKQGQRHDLQQWAPGGKTTLAVDGHGRLRIGGIVIASETKSGKQRLVAILPGGKRVVLAE